MNFYIISFGLLLLLDSILTEYASTFEGFRELNPFYINIYISISCKVFAVFILIYYRKELKKIHFIILNIIPLIIVLNNIIQLARVL